MPICVRGGCKRNPAAINIAVAENCRIPEHVVTINFIF